MVISINLTKDYVAYVDPIDADLVSFKWKAKIELCIGYELVYAVTSNNISIGMHRIILSRILDRPLLSTEYCDHIDGNPLNNSRCNLRLATNSQNQMNRRVSNNKSCPLKGVTWHKQCQKWQAQIKINNKNKHLGIFGSPEEAHEAYCKAATELFGEFARKA